MNRTIWKFEFGNGFHHQLQMPLRAVPICIQIQGGKVCIWAEVDPRAAVETRTFWVVGTGHELPPEPRKYIGTIQQPPFVWHIYEELHA